MLKIPLKILYFLLPVLFAIIFIVDILLYYSQLEILFIITFREIIIAVALIILFFVAGKRLHLENLSLRQKLIRLSFLILSNYVLVFILNLFMSPEYTDEFPQHAISLSAVIFSNILGIFVIFTLIPVLFIFRDFIFYRQKRWTNLLFRLFLFFSIVTGISVAVTRQPLNFQMTSQSFYNDLFFAITILLILLLALRNDWLTYLPRKEKMLFFFLGILVYGAILNLFDRVYSPYLTPYSLFLAAFGNIMWLFMVIYGGFTIVKLMFHLPTAKAFDRKIKEVNSLYDLSRILNNELDFRKLTRLITQLIARVLESHSTWLELYDPQEKKLSVISQINLTSTQILTNPFHTLDGFNREILTNKRAILINDVAVLKELRFLLNWKKDARTILAAPLFSNRDQLMGILYATKPHPFGFDVEDVSLLEGFANQAAIALENTELLKESIERERLQQELKIARDVQLKLLPQTIPAIVNHQIDCFSLTASEVGGDYYDFIQFADDKPGVIIGDVSGKGTSAAFYMAEFKGVIQTLARTHQDPVKMLSQANKIFYRNIERKTFISSIVGKINPESGEIQIVRAGHTPAIYCKNGNAAPQILEPAGLGIGLDNGRVFDKVLSPQLIKMQPGDMLLLYTDGLTEARNASGEEFGEERVCNLAHHCSRMSVLEVREKIMKEILRFVGDTLLHDDLTILLVKYDGPETEKTKTKI